MTRSPETLELMIQARIARLYADALVAANEDWKRTHPEKPIGERFDELVQKALARRRRGGYELR